MREERPCKCPACAGTGLVPQPCQTCHGAKIIWNTVEFEYEGSDMQARDRERGAILSAINGPRHRADWE